jgi:putative FmdB family regulatory protein
MPTYEYRCPNGHEFDLFQSMSDEPGALCPECGESAERLMSGGAGLIFKGEGFYITDYRSDAYKKAASSDKEASSSEKQTSGGDSAEKSSGGKGSSDGGGGSSDGGGGSSDGGSSKSKGSSSGGSKTSQSAKSSSSDS